MIPGGTAWHTACTRMQNWMTMMKIWMTMTALQRIRHQRCQQHQQRQQQQPARYPTIWSSGGPQACDESLLALPACCHLHSQRGWQLSGHGGLMQIMKTKMKMMKKMMKLAVMCSTSRTGRTAQQQGARRQQPCCLAAEGLSCADVCVCVCV